MTAFQLLILVKFVTLTARRDFSIFLLVNKMIDKIKYNNFHIGITRYVKLCLDYWVFSELLMPQTHLLSGGYNVPVQYTLRLHFTFLRDSVFTPKGGSMVGVCLGRDKLHEP